MIDKTKLAREKPWKDAYLEIEHWARAVIKAHPGMTWRTAELAEAIFPESMCLDRHDLYARARVFKGLLAMARNVMADCATQGFPVAGKFGGTQRPWTWHTPVERFKVPCKHCKGEGFTYTDTVPYSAEDKLREIGSNQGWKPQ